GRVAVAGQELALKRTQLADRERRLRAEVRMKAGELLAARRNLEIADELLDANRRSFRIVGNRVREGAAPTIDENLQLVEVNRLDASRQVLASRVEVATLQLKLLAGMAADATLGVRGDLTISAPPLDPADAVRRAPASRPALAAAKADVALARAMIRKEQAEGRWDASVSVGYMRQDFGFGLNGLTNSGQIRPIQDVFHYFGGGVTVMLPVRNRNQGNIAAAEAGVLAAERRLEFATLMVQQEVDAAFAQLEAARRSLEIYGRGVRDVARRNLEVVRGSYELGRGSLLDVIAEQRRYIDVETGYTDALKQVYDAAVDVERAVGITERVCKAGRWGRRGLKPFDGSRTTGATLATGSGRSSWRCCWSRSGSRAASCGAHAARHWLTGRHPRRRRQRRTCPEWRCPARQRP